MKVMIMKTTVNTCVWINLSPNNLFQLLKMTYRKDKDEVFLNKTHDLKKVLNIKGKTDKSHVTKNLEQAGIIKM